MRLGTSWVLVPKTFCVPAAVLTATQSSAYVSPQDGSLRCGSRYVSYSNDIDRTELFRRLSVVSRKNLSHDLSIDRHIPRKRPC